MHTNSSGDFLLLQTFIMPLRQPEEGFTPAVAL